MGQKEKPIEIMIASKLVQARKDAGFTQEEAAELIGVARQSISNWENGRTYPEVYNIIQLSEVYHISLDQLLKGDEQLMTHLQSEAEQKASFRKIMSYVLFNALLLIGLFVITLFFQASWIKYLFVITMMFSTGMLAYFIFREL